MRNKMASQPLFVNEILSYLLFKHSILRDNELKRIVLDYYNSDDISSARDTLLTDFENLKLGEDAPRFSDKVDYSSSSCVDDMFIMLEYLENKYIVHLLPRYVTENLANVSSYPYGGKRCQTPVQWNTTTGINGGVADVQVRIFNEV